MILIICVQPSQSQAAVQKQDHLEAPLWQIFWSPVSCAGMLFGGPVNQLQDLWYAMASTVSAGNMQSFSSNKKKYQDQPPRMCFCMHVALFDWDVSVFADACVCFTLTYLGSKCPIHVHVCVLDASGCVCMRTQNTEVGNILMSKAKQEIGNTFKSLALSTVAQEPDTSPAWRVTGCIMG